ncbi:MAG: hypothetical protein OXI05_02565 [Bacteroidota bacterium]|nr:hypothetical protein [Bacteroidota bacterium]MDE2644709.1 hypothetical protein [Bacteroidota bacterium]
MMFDSNRGWILILLLLSAVGCSAPGSRSLVDTMDTKVGDEVLIDWTEYEDFNPEAYREQLEDPSTMIQHDVPEVLLSADLLLFDPSDAQSGFRIQIISTLDKQEADQVVEDALAWWRNFVKDASLYELYPQNEPEPPVYQDFRAPYYRVRLGNFINRDDAELFLEVVEKSYASAFIAPDMVIIGTPIE